MREVIYELLVRCIFGVFDQSITYSLLQVHQPAQGPGSGKCPLCELGADGLNHSVENFLVYQAIPCRKSLLGYFAGRQQAGGKFELTFSRRIISQVYQVFDDRISIACIPNNL